MGCGSSKKQKKSIKYSLPHAKLQINTKSGQEVTEENVEICIQEAPTQPQSPYKNIQTHSAEQKLKKYNKQLQQNICPQKNSIKQEIQSKLITENQIFKSKFIQIKQSQILDRYLILRQLGKGNFGEVKLGIQKITQRKVAIKILSKSNVVQSGFSIKTIKQEIEILKQSDHPNLLQLLEVYEDDEYFYVVTDYYQGGTLKELIGQQKKLNEKQIALIMKQLLSAMNYCHQVLRVIHQDLKTENVMFEKKGDLSSLKIVDFGLARPIDQKTQLNQLVGTPYYFCPQQLMKQKIINEKGDIWSLGVILYQLIANKKPFDGNDFTQLFDSISFSSPKFSDKIWKDYSKELQSFIQKLLAKDHKKRLSAEEALNSKWIIANAPQNNTTLQKEIQDKLIVNQHKIDEKFPTSTNGQQDIRKIILKFCANFILDQSRTTDIFYQFQTLDKQNFGIVFDNNIKTLTFSDYLLFSLPIELLTDEDILKRFFKMLDEFDVNYLTHNKIQSFFSPFFENENKMFTDKNLSQLFNKKKIFYNDLLALFK